MPSFKITVAYDGTDFVGWQRQANGVSIQGLIEDALADIDVPTYAHDQCPLCAAGLPVVKPGSRPVLT